MSLFLTDPSTKQPSVTLTVFVTGCLVATLKLLLSGIVIHGITMSPFSGGDYGMAIGALGGVYVLRRLPTTSSASDSETKSG